MSVPAEIFRTYDIRGVVGRSLTPEIVRDIGRALGSLGRERKAPVFAVCRDGRLSGPELVAALTQGLNAAGADVIDIGMAPTPVAYFAAHHLGTGSCVAVSGSHNPPQYNGLKIVVAGDTLYGEDIQELRRRIEKKQLGSGSGKKQTPRAKGPSLGWENLVVAGRGKRGSVCGITSADLGHVEVVLFLSGEQPCETD